MLNNDVFPYLYRGGTSLLDDVRSFGQAQINPWGPTTAINQRRILSGGRLILSYEEMDQIVGRAISIGFGPRFFRAVLPRGIISDELLDDMVERVHRAKWCG